MCLSPRIPKDNSAEIARQQAAEREAAIRAGTEQIDQTFQGFNDDYFGGVQGDYTSYYLPQVEDQYEDARRKLILSLGGNRNASAGARQIGALTEAYNTNRTAIADRAAQAANDLRAQVESARSDLYSQNRAAADPSAAAAAAAARANTLMAPQSYSPLGALFSGFLPVASDALTAESRGYKGWDTGRFNTGIGSGSAKVVA